MSSKKQFRATPDQKLGNAVAQGNNLILGASAAKEAWEDLDAINRECTAMTTAPGIVLNYTSNPELMAQVDAEQVDKDTASLTRMLMDKQQELIAIRKRVKEHPQRAEKTGDHETSMVAALDMAEEYNQWIDSLSRTVYVATDTVLQHFRNAPLNMEIPVIGQHYQAFHPSEVGVGNAPAEAPAAPIA